MSDDATPRWDLLPHRPAEFFGLESGYDLPALRRSYSALIRRYPPDHFPTEFRQIRAAYETLSDALRYFRRHEKSLSMETGPPTSFPLNADGVDPAQVRHQAAPWADRAAKESAEALFAELRDKPLKSPREYYYLATLADLAAPDDPLGFSRWLLAAVDSQKDVADPRRNASWRQETWGLWRLLRAYFAGPIPLAILPDLLELASQHVHGDRYFWLTEPSWMRLLAEEEFSKFRRTLSACEEHLQDRNDICHLSFYLRLLPPALWKADPEWIGQTLTRIEENWFHAQDSLDEEFQRLDELLEYHRDRSAFLAGHAARRQIDQALAEWHLLGPIEGRAAVVECQHWIASHGDQVLTAFPPEEEIQAGILTPWYRAADEVREQFGEATPDWDEDLLNQETERLMLRLLREAARTPFARHLHSPLRGALIVAPTVGFLFIVWRLIERVMPGPTWTVMGWQLLEFLGWAGASLTLVYGYFRIISPAVEHAHLSRFRPLMLELLTRLPAPLLEIRRSLRRLAGRKIDGVSMEYIKEVARPLRDDVGLAIFQRAQLQLRCEAEASPATDDRSLQRELEEYAVRRGAFLNGCPARERIDLALHGQSIPGGVEAVDELISCQRWIAAHPRELLRAFPAGGEDFSFLLLPWRRLAEQARSHGLSTRANDQAANLPATDRQEAAERLVRTCRRCSRSEWWFAFFGIGAFLVFPVTLAVMLALYVRLAKSTSIEEARRIFHLFLGTLVPLGVWGLLLGLSWGAAGPLRRLSRCAWRWELFRLLECDRASRNELHQDLTERVKTAFEGKPPKVAEEMLDLLKSDAAVEIYATACGFG